ncbi:hypothetical protein K9F62_03315 [Desulfovibrio sp. JY]|nr:hypothetical protein K9F62_03315 [Desulfovibrio sp. JY]
MNRKALEIALAAGQNLSRRLETLKEALEAGNEAAALDMAREITGAKRQGQQGQACR